MPSCRISRLLVAVSVSAPFASAAPIPTDHGARPAAVARHAPSRASGRSTAVRENSAGLGDSSAVDGIGTARDDSETPTSSARQLTLRRWLVDPSAVGGNLAWTDEPRHVLFRTQVGGIRRPSGQGRAPKTALSSAPAALNTCRRALAPSLVGYSP